MYIRQIVPQKIKAQKNVCISDFRGQERRHQKPPGAHVFWRSLWPAPKKKGTRRALALRTLFWPSFFTFPFDLTLFDSKYVYTSSEGLARSCIDSDRLFTTVLINAEDVFFYVDGNSRLATTSHTLPTCPSNSTKLGRLLDMKNKI